MSLIAAIDIGTNSIKMTIADVVNGKLDLIRTESKTTRLGRGVDQTGRLEETAMAVTLSEVVRLAGIAAEMGVAAIAVVGTSALRDAQNGGEFLRRVQEQAGLEIEIVTGDREAELAYLAVLTDESLAIDRSIPLAVFDMGGGSTELILGLGERLLAHKSVNIGAVRITERYLPSDPPEVDELEAASTAACEILATAQLPFEIDGAIGANADGGSGIQLVGLGGSLVNLASIRSNGEGDPHGARITSAEISSVLARLSAVDLAERKKIVGLSPDRADVIIGGALIVLELLRYFGADSLRVSTRGLRFGLLGELAARVV